MSRLIRADGAVAGQHRSQISNGVRAVSVPGVSGGTNSAVMNADALGQRLRTLSDRYASAQNRNAMQIDNIATRIANLDREAARQIDRRG